MRFNNHPLKEVPGDKLALFLSQALSELTGSITQVQVASLALEGDNAATIQLQVQFAPGLTDDGDTAF